MTKHLHQWAGKSIDQWQPVGETDPALPPGIYCIQAGMSGPFLQPVKPNMDKVIIIEDGLTEVLFDGIERFWNKKKVYDDFGMLHKRGVLMEGPPGTGKTMAAMLLCNRLVSRGASSLLLPAPHFNVSYVTSMMRQIREIHPEMPLLVLLEDLNAMCDPNYSDNTVERILALLDGQNQINNVVYLATTNFINKLDARLTNRPSRFDEVIHCGPPSEKARLSYLRQIIPPSMAVEQKHIEKMAKASDGLMMAHIRELVCSHLALDKPLDDVVKRLRTMQDEAQKRAELGEEKDDE